jgi:UDPglucose 6-dehydrogenase
VAIWGLAFKPQTDDMREAPSLVIIDELVNAGANVVVYDPIAMNECQRLIGDKVKYTNNKYDCLNDVDALVIVTEWNEFRSCDLFEVKKRMAHPFIVDGRNILNVDDVKNEGFVYSKIG